LPPRPRRDLLVGRRDIDRVVHPAVPRGPDRRGLRVAVVDDPAPLEAERRVDLAALGPVVAVAELVLADELTVAVRPPLRTEGLVIPPGEEPGEKGRDFHRNSLAHIPAKACPGFDPGWTRFADTNMRQSKAARPPFSCQRPEPLSRAAQPQPHSRIDIHKELDPEPVEKHMEPMEP